MPKYYDLGQLPTTRETRVGDVFVFGQRRRSPTGPVLVDDEAVADWFRSEAESELRKHGVLATATVVRSEFVTGFDYEFEIEARVTGLTNPETPVLLAGTGELVAKALLLIAGFLAAGWFVSEIKGCVVELNQPGAAADTISLFPVAAAIVAIVYLLSKA